MMQGSAGFSLAVRRRRGRTLCREGESCGGGGLGFLGALGRDFTAGNGQFSSGWKPYEFHFFWVKPMVCGRLISLGEILVQQKFSMVFRQPFGGQVITTYYNITFEY